MAKQGVRDEDALELALGAPLRAVALQQNDGIAIRHQWAELWSAVASARKDPLTAAAAIDKESLAEHLQWAQLWLVIRLRELLVTPAAASQRERSEEHTSELQSLMRISYAVFCWKKKIKQ